MRENLPSRHNQYLMPAFGRLYSRLAEVAWLALRMAVGASLIPHGMQKLFMSFNGPGIDKFIISLAGRGFAAPTLMGWLVAIVEFAGGILLSVGLLTRPTAGVVFVFMMVAVFSTHLANGFFWTDKGFEYPLMWGIAALFFVVHGGGAYSIDRLISRSIWK